MNPPPRWEEGAQFTHAPLQRTAIPQPRMPDSKETPGLWFSLRAPRLGTPAPAAHCGAPTRGTHMLLTSVPAVFSSTSSVTSRPAGNWGCYKEDTPHSGEAQAEPSSELVLASQDRRPERSPSALGTG